MKKIEGGKRGEAANDSGQHNEPEIMLPSNAIVHLEHGGTALDRSRFFGRPQW
jgi:hypothetical protein